VNAHRPRSGPANDAGRSQNHRQSPVRPLDFQLGIAAFALFEYREDQRHVHPFLLEIHANEAFKRHYEQAGQHPAIQRKLFHCMQSQRRGTTSRHQNRFDRGCETEIGHLNSDANKSMNSPL
jgi:hypothetical protein